jgi:hypothetical protein
MGASGLAAVLAAVHKGGIGLPGGEASNGTELFGVSGSGGAAGTRTVVGAASAAAALSDNSDSSYLQLPSFDGNPVQIYRPSFALLTQESGRPIQSFIVQIRMSDSEIGAIGFELRSSTVFPSSTGNGLLASPMGAFTEVVYGPFSRSGGGFWTALEFRNLLSSNGLFTEMRRLAGDRISKMRLIVSYPS